jgi:GT2 family glycosyltransferase
MRTVNEASHPPIKRTSEEAQGTNGAARLGLVGYIVIGRNEGQRLERALRSIRQAGNEYRPLVYVDSGSTDNSVELAHREGCIVLHLDMSSRFTAARARNQGAAAISSAICREGFLFFMDGDCSLVPGFIEKAVKLMQADPTLAIVCGRNRELEPRKNIYHRLAEMEWNTEVGVVLECGGNALVRRTYFEATGGFNSLLIAGEEAELCERLRSAGGKIRRIPVDMTYHDIAMNHFSQWWRRSVRTGYAYFLNSQSKRRSLRERCIANIVRAQITTAVIVSAVLLPLLTSKSALALIACACVVPLHGAYISRRAKGDPVPDAALYSIMCLSSKPAEVQGHLKCALSLLLRRGHSIIEHKKG